MGSPFLKGDRGDLPTNSHEQGMIHPQLQKSPPDPPFEKGGRGDFHGKEEGINNSSLSAEIQQRIAKLAPALKASRNPVLICGTDIVAETTPAVVGACARSLLEKKGKCGLFYVLPGANAFGAMLLGSAGDHAFRETVEAIERDEVKALIVVESDPFWLFPDRSRLEQALARLELLLVLDYVPSPIVQQAHIFLPTLTLFETDSSFINQEGRIQFAHPAYHGGTPVSEVSGGSHPPRTYSGELPGGEPKPAWQILADLAAALSVEVRIGQGENPLSLAVNEHPLLAGLQNMNYPIDGVRCIPDSAEAEPVPTDTESAISPDTEKQLELLLVDSIFGTEELSLYSKVIQQVEGEPCLHMHAEDAAELGFAEGDRISLTLDAGTLEIRVSLSKTMAPGTLVLPRHRKLDWQKVKDFSTLIPSHRIKKT